MRKKVLTLTAVLAAAVLLAGCTDATNPRPQSTPTDGPHVLRVLAGSEVKDMLPLFTEAEKVTGVHVNLTYTGTLDGTEAVANGQTQGRYDATWFPSDRYLNLLQGGTAAVRQETKVMSSPVVLGLKKPVAARLGWDRKTPTWTDIVTAVRSGQLTYGMASPVSSNSGFSALIEAATALSGTGNALVSADIKKVSPNLVTLFQGQTLTSGSSGWLADKFAANSNQADGLFNYESLLNTVRVSGQPLTIIRPSDGIITADYPLALLTSAKAGKSGLYTKLTGYLMRPDVQRQIAARTHRFTTTNPRPSTASVFELPFPNQLSTVKALLGTYLGRIKKPSDAVFTIDTSGSMGEGGRLARLQQALSFTTQTDAANTFTSYQSRESVTYVNFAGGIKGVDHFGVSDATRTADLRRISGYIKKLSADGGTAIYDALETSYQHAASLKQQHPGNFVSVVLFTDGENNAGRDLGRFVDDFQRDRASNPALASIPTYVVLFGEGNTDDLTKVANLTGGKVFDAQHSNLTDVFKEIRGYQ